MNNLTIEMLRKWLLEQPDDITFRSGDRCQCFVAQYYTDLKGQPVNVDADGFVIDCWPYTPVNFNSDSTKHKQICDFIELFDGVYDGLEHGFRTKAKTLEILDYVLEHYPVS